METKEHTELRRLYARLVACQKGARVRKMDEGDVEDAYRDIVKFLDDAPVGTSVRGPLWDRVANSYRGVPEGTTLLAERTAEGIRVDVRRSAHAFGNRAWLVSPPKGFKVAGPTAHASTGSVGDLTTTEVVSK